MTKSAGIVGSVLTVIVVCAIIRIVFHTDPITWLDAGTDWTVSVAYHYFPNLRGINR